LSARRIAAVARRIVEQFRRDRRTLGFLVVVPLLMLVLIGYLFQPQGGASREPVALVNEDQGPLGGLLAEALAGTPSLDARRLSAGAAEAALREGAVHATVTFPATFTTDSLRTQRVPLAIRLEGSDLFVNASTLGAIQRASVEAVSSALARSPLAGGRGGLALEISYLHGGADWGTLDYLAPVLIPYLAFFFVFLLTDVSFLRERASGTLERLLATPLHRAELVLGYLAGFSVFAVVQSVIVVGFALTVLGLKHAGSPWTILVINVILVLGTVNLGLFLSAFAKNEFQAVQFIPVVVLPQLLLSGMLIPVDALPDLLRPLAWLLPLTYANEASRAVMIKGASFADPLVLRDLGALVLVAAVLALAATRTIRREVA